MIDRRTIITAALAAIAGPVWSRTALAQAQQRAGGPRDRLQIWMRGHHDIRRQVLCGEIERDRFRPVHVENVAKNLGDIAQGRVPVDLLKSIVPAQAELLVELVQRSIHLLLNGLYVHPSRAEL